MKRPILVATIAYINGIIIGVYLKKSIPLFIISAIIIIPIINLKKYKYKNIINLYLITLCICSIYTYKKDFNYENKYKKYDSKNIKILGTIISDIKEKEYKDSFIIKSKGDYLLINIKKDKNKKEIEYGDEIEIKGEYEEPSKARNYKGFDYKNYLKTNKIYGTINVTSYNNVKIISQKNLNIIDMFINQIRTKIKNNIKEILPENTASLAMGILIGYDDQIDEQIILSFKNSNLSHMLAISGAHINYVILTVSLIFPKKKIGKNSQKVITIIVMIFFMKLTQMTPSVIRAGISCIIYMMASLLYKKADIANTIAISTLFTLINNPFSLFNIGMQLSYAGSIGIIVFFNLIDIQIKNKFLKYIKDSILISISANIFIMPIMAYQFNTISITFILSNLLAGPILGLSIIIEIIISILSFISIKIVKIPAIILNFLLLSIIKISKFFSDISISKITIVTPSLITIVIYYIMSVTIAKNKLKINKNTKIIFICITILIISIKIPLKNKSLKLNFIDVGQGDSTLITTIENKIILIDGGGSLLANSFDVGSKTLLPYLLDRKVRKIDYIMVSHFDADHCQGLETVIDNIKVKNIIVCKQPMITEEYLKIIKKCKQKKINIIVVKRGDKINIDKATMLNILHPTDKFLDDGKGGLNANAIVCKLKYRLNNNKYFTVLFTGDIEEAAEKELEQVYNKKLKADILKVAHHGSKTSSRKEFIALVSPKIALIGVGKKNKFRASIRRYT